MSRHAEKIHAKDWTCTLILSGKDYFTSTQTEISGSQSGHITLTFFFDQKPEIKTNEIDVVIECKDKSVTSIDFSNKKFVKENGIWHIKVDTKSITSTVELRKESKSSSIATCLLFTTNFRDLQTVCQTILFQ